MVLLMIIPFVAALFFLEFFHFNSMYESHIVICVNFVFFRYSVVINRND